MQLDTIPALAHGRPWDGIGHDGRSFFAYGRDATPHDLWPADGMCDLRLAETAEKGP